MGVEYRYICTACGIAGSVFEGMGESASSTAYFCNDCSEIFEFWETHNFGGAEDDMIFDQYLKDPDHSKYKSYEDYKTEKLAELELAKSAVIPACKSCDSKDIKALHFKKKMKCPHCHSSEFHFATYADWD